MAARLTEGHSCYDYFIKLAKFYIRQRTTALSVVEKTAIRLQNKKKETINS